MGGGGGGGGCVLNKTKISSIFSNHEKLNNTSQALQFQYLVPESMLMVTLKLKVKNTTFHFQHMAIQSRFCYW